MRRTVESSSLLVVGIPLLVLALGFLALCPLASGDDQAEDNVQAVLQDVVARLESVRSSNPLAEALRLYALTIRPLIEEAAHSGHLHDQVVEVVNEIGVSERERLDPPAAIL